MEVEKKCLSDWLSTLKLSRNLRFRSRLQRTGANLGMKFRDTQENNNFSGYIVMLLQ